VRVHALSDGARAHTQVAPTDLDSYFPKLAAALRSPACFRSLTRLHLGQNPLRDAGVHALACALGGLPASPSSSSSAAPGEGGGGGGDAAGGGRRSTVDGISVTLLCGACNTHSPPVAPRPSGFVSSYER